MSFPIGTIYIYNIFMALYNTYKNVELLKDILKVPTYQNFMNHDHNNITAFKVQGVLLMMLLNS